MKTNYKYIFFSYIILISSILLYGFINQLVYQCLPKGCFILSILIVGLIEILILYIFYKLFHFQIDKSKYKINILVIIILLINLLFEFMNHKGFTIITSFIFDLFIIGLFEETLFRGIYYDEFRKSTSNIPFTFFSSICFFIIYKLTNNLIVASLFHMMFNIAGEAITVIIFAIYYLISKYSKKLTKEIYFR